MSETTTKGYLTGRFAYSGAAKEGLPPIKDGQLVLKSLNEYYVDSVNGVPRGVVPHKTTITICDGRFKGFEDDLVELATGYYSAVLQTSRWSSKTAAFEITSEHTKENPLDLPSLFLSESKDIEYKLKKTFDYPDGFLKVVSGELVTADVVASGDTSVLQSKVATNAESILELETKVNSTLSTFQEVESRVGALQVSVSSLSSEDSLIDERVRTLESREDPSSALDTLQSRIETLEQATPQPVDLSEIEAKLSIFESYEERLKLLEQQTPAEAQDTSSVYDSGWYIVNDHLALPEGVLQAGFLMMRRIGDVVYVNADNLRITRGSYRNVFSETLRAAVMPFTKDRTTHHVVNTRTSAVIFADARNTVELQFDKLSITDLRLTAHGGNAAIGITSWITDTPTPDVFPGKAYYER